MAKKSACPNFSVYGPHFNDVLPPSACFEQRGNLKKSCRTINLDGNGAALPRSRVRHDPGRLALDSAVEASVPRSCEREPLDLARGTEPACGELVEPVERASGFRLSCGIQADSTVGHDPGSASPDPVQLGLRLGLSRVKTWPLRLAQPLSSPGVILRQESHNRAKIVLRCIT